jgi:hypothetical protein
MRARVDNVTMDSRGQALQVRGLLIGIDCVVNNVNDLICVGAVNMETQVAEDADSVAGVPHSLPVYQDTYDNVIGFGSPLTTTVVRGNGREIRWSAPLAWGCSQCPRAQR